MKYLNKPEIKTCEFQKNINLDGSLTRLRLNPIGWGLLKISSEEHPKWIGIKKIIIKNDRIFTFLVPKNSIIEVNFSNIFGSSKNYFKSPAPDYKFNKVPLPSTLISKKLKLKDFKSLVLKAIYSEQIISKFLRVKINIKKDSFKKSGIKFVINNKLNNQIIDMPKINLKKSLIKQHLKNHSIKI